MDNKHFSHKEASDLLAAAARLEANSSISTGAGLTLDEVREAAVAAGIDPRFVEAAMHMSRAQQEEKTWLRAPLDTIRSVMIPGHLDDAAWGRVVALLREQLGESGTPETIGNSRRWTRQGTVVTAEPAGEDTLIQLRADRSGVVKGMGITSLVSAGVALFMGVISLLASAMEPLAVSGILAMLAVIYGSVAWLVSPLQHRKMGKKFDRVADKLSTVVGVQPTVSRHPAQSSEAVQAPVDAGAGQEPRIASSLLDSEKPEESADYPYGQVRSSSRN